tara:strand:- start:244 stop:537 length:294 start_codon:yes stop_codon:yes gene_type:complete
MGKLKNWKRKKMLNVVSKEIWEYCSILDGMEDEFYTHLHHLEEQLIESISNQFIENKKKYNLKNETDKRIKNFTEYLMTKVCVEFKISSYKDEEYNH